VLTAIVVGVLGVLVGVPGLARTSSPAASEEATRAVAPGRIVVEGVAKRKSGSVIKHGRISVHPLRESRRPALVGGGRTDERGRFKIKVRRSASLARYAARHNGRLNLMLWIYKGKRVYLRSVQVPYRQSGKRPARDTYSLGPTRLLASQRLGREHAKVPSAAKAIDVSEWVTLGRITATKDVTTTLSYHNNIETAASVGIVIGDTLTMSGSMQLAESTGAGVGAELRGKKTRQAIQVELDYTSSVACDWRGWLTAYGGRQCVTYVRPAWNGGFRAKSKKYLSCGHPSVRERWFKAKNIVWNLVKDKGRAFTSTVELGGLGVAARTSTKFSDTNQQTWLFPRARDTKFDYFCLGGIGTDWQRASEVVTQSRIMRTCPPVVCPLGRSRRG